MVIIRLRPYIIRSFLICLTLIVVLGGCGTQAPTKEGAAKAIEKSVLTSGSGAKFIVLKSPVSIQSIVKQKGEKSWLVIAKFSFTYKMGNGAETKELTRLFPFMVYPVGLFGKPKWEAQLNPQTTVSQPVNVMKIPKQQRTQQHSEPPEQQ